MFTVYHSLLIIYVCSGMAGVMDTLYRNMNEQCAAYLSRITVTDIETQLFTQE